jgi:hypothetical protein
VTTVKPECVSCGANAPETNTNHTVIQQGWRLERRQADDGKHVLAWWCAACWARRKTAAQQAPLSPKR